MVGKVLEFARERLAKKANANIKGIWNVDCYFQPVTDERLFDCNFLIAQTEMNGIAYTFKKISDSAYLKSLVGQNYFNLNIENNALNIAILDSIFASHIPFPSESYKFFGQSSCKLEKRSEIINNEVSILLKDKIVNSTPIKVLNVGAVGNIIKHLLRLPNCTVLATDYDPSLINKELESIEVQYGDNTIKLMDGCDVIIITGMAILSRDIEFIIKKAIKIGCKIIVYAETGANLIDFYFSLGIDVFISEPFPFYIFYGKTEINVYRNNSSCRS